MLIHQTSLRLLLLVFTSSFVLLVTAMPALPTNPDGPVAVDVAAAGVAAALSPLCNEDELKPLMEFFQNPGTPHRVKAVKEDFTEHNSEVSL
jgi:hypothetical protein